MTSMHFVLLMLLLVIQLLMTIKYVLADDISSTSNPRNFYSYIVKDIDGKAHHLSQYFGKVSLVVNVASECGYTDSHYHDLVQLYAELEPRGFFTVLAFPCNDFGEQEPWAENQIKSHVRERYGVRFPLFSKISLLSSTDVPTCWQYLIDRSGHRPTWNFWKYLVSWKGEVIESWGPWVEVPSIRAIIDRAVKQAERMSTRSDEL